jgi:hypothetical protein
MANVNNSATIKGRGTESSDIVARRVKWQSNSTKHWRKQLGSFFKK